MPTDVVGIEQVLVSPILRAQQTADIFMQESGLHVPRSTVEWLIHETPVSVALKALAELDKSTLLVGHQPLAGSLVQRLTGASIGIGTANLIEMEGESFITGFLTLKHHAIP